MNKIPSDKAITSAMQTKPLGSELVKRQWAAQKPLVKDELSSSPDIRKSPKNC